MLFQSKTALSSFRAMTDFEEASAAAFQSVFGKIGLKDDSINDAHVRDSVHCLVALPLLPPQAIPDVVVDIQGELDSDSTHSSNLRKLIAYVQRQWVTKRSIGPARLSVRDNRCRTNNILESYHASLRRRIKVSHPNL